MGYFLLYILRKTLANFNDFSVSSSYISDHLNKMQMKPGWKINTGNMIADINYNVIC